MFAERQKGITYSAALHVVVLLLVIFGMPSLFNRERIEEPSAITVELLPISTISNVKPAEKQSPSEKEAEQKEQEKPSPPVKTAEAPPPPPEKPAEVKKPADKPKEKPKDEKKEDKNKPKEEDLAAVLKAVKDTAQKSKDKDKKEKDKDGGSKSISNQYDPTLPLSISEKDAIRSQIAKCWSVPAGAKDAENLIVVLQLEMSKDGSVIKVEMTRDTKARYNRDTFFRAAVDSAIRAVKQCSPLKNLPADKYATWRDMELTFDPKEMLF